MDYDNTCIFHVQPESSNVFHAFRSQKTRTKTSSAVNLSKLSYVRSHFHRSTFIGSIKGHGLLPITINALTFSSSKHTQIAAIHHTNCVPRMSAYSRGAERGWHT